MDLAPSLNNDVVCITDDPILAAVISSYFSEKGTYFTVFPFVKIKEKPKTLTARIVTERSQKHIRNRIVKLKPKRIIFAGLNAFQKSCFSFPAERILEIEKIEEVDEKLSTLTTATKEIFACRTNDISQGLFLAKKKNCRLTIDENADTPILTTTSATGIFILEGENDLSSICTVNLAHASGSDIGFIPAITRKQAYSIKTAIERAGNREDGFDFQEPLEEVRVLIQGLNLSSYKWVTFLTQGIPYPLLLSDTHAVSLLYRPPAAMTIFDSLYKEQFSSNFYSALFFSVPVNEADRLTGIISDETPVIMNRFIENGFLIVPLVNRGATKRNFGNFVAHFPYDVLHIGSHGGGFEGTFNKITLTDIDGVKHVLEYYRTYDFEPLEKIGEDGKPVIAVVSMIVPHTYDGYVWGELPEGYSPNGMKVLEEFMTNSMDGQQKDDYSIPVNGRIPHSKYIQCVDNIHQGQFHLIAGQTDPFIFNNSCCSWFDMGTNLLGVGARAYIGTLWNIGTDTAKASAEEFYRLAFERNLSLMRCCREVVKSIKNPLYKKIYVYWGLPWTRIAVRPKGGTPATLIVIAELKEAEDRYTALLNEPDYDQSLKKNIEPILKFLKKTRSDLLKTVPSFKRLLNSQKKM